MIINKSDLDVLFDLGVSRSQACVYLALLKTGTLSLSEVSKSSGVSRPDSYRAISKLVDMGLVERIISNPTKFRPLSMNEGLSILLGQKEKENSELRLEAAHLSEEFKESRLVIETNDINHQFVSVAEGDGLLLKLNKMTKCAQKNICLMLTQRKLLFWLLYDDALEDALKRGVSIKVLTEKSKTPILNNDLVKLVKNYSLDIRYLTVTPNMCFGIFDSNEVILAISAKIDLPPAIWSNNDCFEEFAHDYFDSAWFTAARFPQNDFEVKNKFSDLIIANVIGGFAYNRIIFGSEGVPVDFVLEQANDAFLSMLGLTEQSLGSRATELFPGIDKEAQLMEAFNKVAALGKMARVEYYSILLNRWYKLTMYTREKNYFAMICEDVTENKMAEEIIKKSEQRYRSLYQAVTGGVIVRDKNGRILEVNNAACKMLGLPEDQIKGRTSKELCPNWPVFREDKSVLPDDEQPAMITLRTGKSVEDYVMVVFNPAKKQYRWILVNSQPMLDSKKDVEAAVTTFIDITDQKKMEEELLNQKNKAESYLNIVGKIILTLDMNGKVTSLNKKACEILGYAQSELKGKDWVDMCIAKENRESTRTFFQELIKGEINSQEHYEGFIITRSGDEKSIVWHSALLKDQTGQISGTLSYGEEVTAHKQMEKALLQSEPFNRVLFETSLYGVLFLTLDGKIFSVNKQACNLLGFSRDKIIQANIFDLIAEEEELKSILKELNIRGKVVTELNYKKGSGETFQYKIEARLFWDTYGNKMISLVMRD